MNQPATPLSNVFAKLQSENKLAFIPFIAAGDPDLPRTAELLQVLADSDADIIEIGFPYSDPIADGPVIQASYTRALQNKITVDQIFSTVGGVVKTSFPPLVAMVSYAIIFRHGTKKFIQEAKQAGFSGFIVPDLPTEEAGELAPLMKSAGLDLIQLLAPTTTSKRTESIVAHSTGFIYCIAVAGITGEREKVADTLLDQLKDLKTKTDTPLAVGFGLSRPEHITPLHEVADGAIVGSAIVKYLQKVADDEISFDRAKEEIKEFASSMAQAAHG